MSDLNIEALVMAKFVPDSRYLYDHGQFAYNNRVTFVYPRRFEFSPTTDVLREMLGCGSCELLKARIIRKGGGEHQPNLKSVDQGILGKSPKRDDAKCQILANNAANDIVPECEKRFRKTQHLRMDLPLITDGDNDLEAIEML